MRLEGLFEALVVKGGVLATVALAGCPEPEDTDVEGDTDAADTDVEGDADTDADGDADTDTDTDSDADGDTDVDCSTAECLNVDSPTDCSSNGVVCCWAFEACCDYCCG